ncbi:MAG: holo-ACP synthase [Candidatus Ornithospirochaeta sp.]
MTPMVDGVGVDIVENKRFSSSSQHMLERIFTPLELKNAEERTNKTEYLGSRFAVKEAVAKALGTGFGPISPSDIETREDDAGRPYVLIRGEEKKEIHISISHEKEYSIAFAVREEL